MRIGQLLKFLTGEYVLLAWDRDSTGVFLAALMDRHKGEFLVCNFREGDQEWGNGRYFSNIHGAVRQFRLRARTIGAQLPEIGE